MTDEADLGTKLLKVESNTIDDGRVRGRIVNLEEDDNTIRLKIEMLSTGDQFKKEFDYPNTWTTENRFVRLVEWSGYNSASVEEIVGVTVPLVSNDDSWVLDFESLPGDSLVDHDDYYRGVARGVIGVAGYGVVAIGLADVAGVIEVSGSAPGVFEAIGLSVVYLVGLVALVWYLWNPFESEKKKISLGEMDVEDVNRIRGK